MNKRTDETREALLSAVSDAFPATLGLDDFGVVKTTLAAHEREIKAEAWDEALESTVEDCGTVHYPTNPYIESEDTNE